MLAAEAEAEAVVGGGYLIGVDFGEIDDRDEDDCENPDSETCAFVPDSD